MNLHVRRGSRDQSLEQSWRRHLADWRASGLSVRAFCRAHNLREGQFYFWRREIQKRDLESSGDSSAGYAVVEMPRSTFQRLSLSAPHRIEIELPSDIRIRIDEDFCSESLSRVLSVLGVV